MADHHPLDVWPIPREEKPLFINEPWLVDDSIYFEMAKQMKAAREPEDQPDNRRVYIPLDLNKAAFLRRLDHVLDKYPDIKAEVIVTSICHGHRMESIFKEYRPDYVFHAAAYKHVPMMENNPSEAVLNNIHGTKVIADLSVKYAVKKFVMEVIVCSLP